MKDNLIEEIISVLKRNKKYLSDDEELLKATVYSDIMTMDKGLISLLLANKRVKETFFVQIGDALVFDKQKFAWLIDSKEFLPDSYTSYTNKIGLTSKMDPMSRTK